MNRTLMSLVAVALAAPAAPAAADTPPGVDAPEYTEVVVHAPVGGTVSATLSITLGTPAQFTPFAPGTAADYTASTTANVISTAGDAALTVADPSSIAPGHLTNGAFSLAQPLLAAGEPLPTTVKTWNAPISNDVVAIIFTQRIGGTEPLRTGAYGKTLTFTLSTTNP